MNIIIDNVNVSSSTGPNSFGNQIISAFIKMGHNIYDLHNIIKQSMSINKKPDIHLAFIEANIQLSIPLIQRLDGIYYNSDEKFGDWWVQNRRIKDTYEKATGIIFQSRFSKKLVEGFFDEKNQDDVTIINNGVNLDEINSIAENDTFDLTKFNAIWMCASNWRPHKRLNENIRYFLDHAAYNDVLIIAGDVDSTKFIHPQILYIGNCTRQYLISLYKRAKYFIHLAYHDNCPNVVVDARAAGCHIICASCSGTSDIAGVGATVIVEDEWEPQLTELYNPPNLNFAKKHVNEIQSTIDINQIAIRYINFMERFV